MNTQEAFVISMFFICSTVVICCIINNKRSVRALCELERQIYSLDEDVVKLKASLRDMKLALNQMYNAICGNQDS